MRNTILLLAFCFSAACTTTDPALFTADGEPVKELPPLHFRVAVTPIADFDVLREATPESRYSFVHDGATVQKMLAEGLRGQRTANDIVLIDKPDDATSTKVRADLVLRPRLVDIKPFEKRGKTGKAWLGGALWLTTWYAGLKVEDRDYNTSMTFEVEVINPHTGERLDTFSVGSNRTALTFQQRARKASGATAATLVIPPFWSPDNPESASISLSNKVVAHVSAAAASWLKQDFRRRERDMLGEVRMIAPRNGATVGAEVDFHAIVLAREEITECDVYVNEERIPPADLFGEGGLAGVDQRADNFYQVVLKPARKLALKPGKNYVAVEYRIAGLLTSRTLVFDVPNPKE